MDIFAQKKFLITTIVVLAVLNISSIGFFFMKDAFAPKGPPILGPKEIHDISVVLEKELNLSEKQVEQIRVLRSGYMEKERVLDRQIHIIRDSMNAIIFR